MGLGSVDEGQETEGYGLELGFLMNAQDVGLLPAMMFLIVWPLCARKIWDAI